MANRWTYTTKLVVLISLLVAGAWVLVRLGAVIPPLVVSFILAFLFKPATDGLVRRTGWSRGLAAATILFVALALLGLTPVLMTPSVTSLISRIRLDPSALNPILERLSQQSLQLGSVTIEGSDLAQRLAEGIQGLITPVASSALQIIGDIATSLIWGLFVLVLVFWLLKDINKLRAWLLDHVAISHRDEFLHLSREMGVVWGSFFRGQLLVSITIGFIIGIAMWILGVPNALFLGVLAGLGEFVPTLGPVIASLPAVLLAAFAGSSWLPVNPLVLAFIVLAIYTIVFQIDQVYLLPRIVGRRVNLHPGLVFAGTIIGASQIGILGVLIAAPVIASLRLLGGYIYAKLRDLDPFVLVAAPAAAKRAGTLGTQPIAGILFDLDGTLIDTDDTTINHLAARLRGLQRLFPDGDARPAVRHLITLGEGPLNWVITQFDRLGLDDEVFRFNAWRRRLLGHRQPEAMQLISGVEAMFAHLKPSYRLALVTTRGRAAVDPFLQRFDLTEMFDAIVTRDDVRRLKPHPEPVLTAIRQLGLQAEQCIMVGDTSVDVHSGHAAGTRTVAVLCGFGERRDLEDADLILDATPDLARWL